MFQPRLPTRNIQISAINCPNIDNIIKYKINNSKLALNKVLHVP